MLGLFSLVLGLVTVGSDGGNAWAKKKKKPVPGQTPVVETPGPQQPAQPSNLPLAVVRLECSSDGSSNSLCDSVQAAATASAGRKYQLVDQSKVEALFQREPSLRGCRRDECRFAITEQLGVTRLIDIIIQSPKHRGVIANVSVFDPGAKGIASDTEVQLKREEAKLRRSIEEAVDLVITTQRLSAQLHLDIKPAGTRVKLINGSGGARELTDAERDGQHEVRVFLGPYTVHVEKPGFLAEDKAVTVAQAGASVAVQLKTQPVAVKFEWSPEGTRVLVDGEVIDSRDRVIEVSEGPHKVEAIAPPGLAYESTVFNVDVRVGMDPVRIALQRLTELRVQAPAGYSVSVDSQVLSSDKARIRGRVAELVLPTTPGFHTVTATSWRGYQISQKVEALPRASTDAVITPPSLVPGAVIGTIGLLATLGGAAVFIVGNTQDICYRPDCTTFFKPDLVGGLLVGLGGAALIAGVGWFGWAASNHPAFHRMPKSSREAALAPRLSVRPVVGTSFAGVLSELRF